MNNLVHNEKVKFRATFVNNIGIALVVMGLAAYIFNVDLPSFAKLIFLGLGLSIGGLGYICAQAILNGLKE